MPIFQHHIQPIQQPLRVVQVIHEQLIDQHIHVKRDVVIQGSLLELHEEVQQQLPYHKVRLVDAEWGFLGSVDWMVVHAESDSFGLGPCKRNRANARSVVL